MTVAFVHGNPATAEVWDYLLDALPSPGGDVVRLSPPGFGAPVPPGFSATVTGYRDWLIGELSRLDGPVDLVGQDWGGAHVLNVAMTRPDLIRTWCSDAIGLFDPDYTWHGHAQIWQTPGAGEAWIAAALAHGAGDLTRRMIDQRCDPVIAERMASHYDLGLGECILSLYRSAAQPAMAELGTALGAAAARPGRVVIPTADHVVGTIDQRRRCAARAGAQVTVLDGYEHWWVTEGGGRRGAAVLTDFWSSVP